MGSDWTRDAFSRARVSDTGQRLDVEFLYDKQVDYFDETTNNGTVAFNGDSRDLSLSLADANDGSFAKMASYPVPYTPGNSQLVELTGTLDATGIPGGTLECFLRSTVSGTTTEQAIPASQWVERSDVRPDRSHIYVIDFQSLKVGTIRFGMNSHGTPHTVTSIDNDSVRQSGYWQIANGSAYWHLYTAGGNTYMEMGYGSEDNAVGFRYVVPADATATMRAICCTVKSESGDSLRDQPGLPRAASTGVSGTTVSTTLIPIISIRPKATFQTYDNLVIAVPKSYSISTSNPIRLDVIYGGALTDAAWADVDTASSMMEVDVAATAITGGRVLDSSYVAPGVRNSATSASGLLGKAVLWDRLGSETGILTLAAVRVGTSNADVLGSINWEEIR